MSTFIVKMELSNTKLSAFAQLAHKKHRVRQGLFVVEGHKSVADTLGCFDLEALIVTPAKANDYSKPSYKDRLLVATSAQMRKLSQLSSAPDVIAIYRLPDWQPDHDKVDSELTLMLDGVQDPGNLGTIIRTADWFGIRQIFASPETADVFTPKVVQSTMGALARVRVFYTDLREVIERHPALPVFGTLLDGSDIYATPLTHKGFIVMGNEGNGLTADMRKRVTTPLLIPSYPPGEPTGESLNVAVATAVVLSEFRRQNIMK